MPYVEDEVNEENARQFHNLYEKYAPEFSYETRKDTKEFDPKSPNGQLMIKVCNEIISQAEKRGEERGKREELKDLLVCFGQLELKTEDEDIQKGWRARKAVDMHAIRQRLKDMGGRE